MLIGQGGPEFRRNSRVKVGRGAVPTTTPATAGAATGKLSPPGKHDAVRFADVRYGVRSLELVGRGQMVVEHRVGRRPPHGEHAGVEDRRLRLRPAGGGQLVD